MSSPVIDHNGGAGVKPITGRHVFWGFVVFFGAIFAMNGVFAYYAISTHTGLDTTSAYRRGLDYNARQKAEQRQTRLGWTPTLTVAATDDRVSLQLKDRNGQPVPYLIVTALLGRPVTTEFDHKLVLKEVSPGVYEADFEKLQPGNWVISIKAEDQTKSNDKVVYRLRKRLWLKPGK